MTRLHHINDTLLSTEALSIKFVLPVTKHIAQ